VADEIVTSGIVFGAAFLGTLARTILPYWDKLRAEPELVFEKKFLGTAAIALATSAVTAGSLFAPMLDLVDDAGNASLAAVFFIVFTAALGTNEIINWALSTKAAPAALMRRKTGGDSPAPSPTPTTLKPPS
jgi:hypothetical protein